MPDRHRVDTFGRNVGFVLRKSLVAGVLGQADRSIGGHLIGSAVRTSARVARYYFRRPDDRCRH